jgi:competence protein ComEA
MRTFIWGALLLCGSLLAVPVIARSQDQPAAKPAAAAPSVNLNTATVEQLETLPGIGRKTAELILQYRQKNGPFKKIEELMNVKGIGEKSFLRIKPLLVVTPPRTEKAGASR